MAALSFRNISKSYGDTEVVAGFNLEVRNHEFIVFLGAVGLRQVNDPAHDRGA